MTTQQGPVCLLHNTKWFKTERMRGFAHRVGDTGEWCNMPIDAPMPAPAPPPTPTQTLPPPQPRSADSTRDSIERQKSLDIAERMYARWASEDDLSVSVHSTRVLMVAAKYAQFLATGQVPQQQTTEASLTEAPDPPHATLEGIPEDDEAPF